MFLLLALLGCTGSPTSHDTAEADADTDTDTDSDSDTDTDTDTDAPLDGGTLYTEVCSGCHGADGHGTSGGPDIVRELARLSDADIVFIVLNGKENMPPMDVTEAEAQAIVDWMRANF